MKNNLYIIGNWKMNKNPTETREFMKEFNKLYEENKNKINSNIFYGIAAPATNLAMLKITSNDCLVVAQNVNENESGSHTGEISINMVKSVGAGAVILGHSERRKMYNETSQKVSQKAQKVIEAGLIPIIAFGETFEEYKMGKTKEVIKKMIKESTKGVNLLQVILAYEPVWAIGTGKTPSLKEIQKICAYIRSITNPNVIIQYGGSVKPKNIGKLMNQKDINGALVGGASLDPKIFIKLLTLNK